MTSVEEKLKAVKSEIRSVLVSCPVGLSIEHFLRDYKECIGISLPFKFFGYNSAMTFLKSLSDVVQVKDSLNGSLLLPIESKLTSHINNLVSKQRKAKGNKRSGRPRPRRTTQNGRTYYQVVRRRQTSHDLGIESNSERDSLDSFGSDELDDLDIIWTTEYPENNEDLNYDKTKCYSPPDRPSPINHKEDSLPTNIPARVKVSNSPANDVQDLKINIKFEGYKQDVDETKKLHASVQHPSTSHMIFTSDESQVPKVKNKLRGSSEFIQATNIDHDHDSLKQHISNRDLDDSDSLDQCTDIKHLSRDLNLLRVSKCARKKGNEIVISAEHEEYLSALANGIITDTSKVNEPYLNLIRLTQKSVNPSATVLSELNVNTQIEEENLTNNLLYNDESSVEQKRNFLYKILEAMHAQNNENNIQGNCYSAISHCTPHTSNNTQFDGHESLDLEFSSDEKNVITSTSSVANSVINAPTEMITELHSKQSSDKYSNICHKKAFITDYLPSFGRGSPLKKLLASVERNESRKNVFLNNSGRSHNDAGGIGRGSFLKSLENKYSN